jgi:UPF0271 protein
MAVPPAELTAEVLYQLGALDACCRAAGTRVRYVKPHGALYNTAARDARTAAAIAEGIAAFGALPLLGLPGSELLAAAAAAGLPAIAEGFAARAYAPDGTLIARGTPGAVLDDVEAIAARCVELAHGEVAGHDGTPVRVEVRSVCVHGDSPGAVTAARRARAALETAGVDVRAFA